MLTKQAPSSTTGLCAKAFQSAPSDATFCYLAGVDHIDTPANASVPANYDSLNVWPALQVPNSTQSPRNTIFLSYGVHHGDTIDAGLIVGAHKIVCGRQANSGFWQSPIYPNKSSPTMDPPYENFNGSTIGCYPDCCLFDIRADETGPYELATVETPSE